MSALMSAKLECGTPRILKILSWALHEGAIVITPDADFHTMLAVSRASGHRLTPVPSEKQGDLVSISRMLAG